MLRDITSMPVLVALDKARHSHAPNLMKRVGIVGVQHLLPSSLPLFDALIHAGVEPGCMYILGKPYSTHSDVLAALQQRGCVVLDGTWPSEQEDLAEHAAREVDQLWGRAEGLQRRNIDSLVVLDDGGRCLVSVPEWARSYRPMGVEQTSRGWHLASNLGRIPTVLVARSAIKLFCEAPIIGRSVANAIEPYFRGVSKRELVGVIGAGPIGAAVASALLAGGRRVAISDRNTLARELAPRESEWMPSRDQLLRNCGLVVGCTGTSAIDPSDLNAPRLRGVRVLVSASSEDKEFRQLLRLQRHVHRSADPLRDIVLQFGELTLRVARGGYPINLSPSVENESADDMQITRGALLAGVYQAACMSHKGVPGSPLLALDAELQQIAVRAWASDARGYGARSSSLDWDNLEQIARKSGGRRWSASSGWSAGSRLPVWTST